MRRCMASWHQLNRGLSWIPFPFYCPEQLPKLSKAGTTLHWRATLCDDVIFICASSVCHWVGPTQGGMPINSLCLMWEVFSPFLILKRSRNLQSLLLLWEWGHSSQKIWHWRSHNPRNSCSDKRGSRLFCWWKWLALYPLPTENTKNTKSQQFGENNRNLQEKLPRFHMI